MSAHDQSVRRLMIDIATTRESELDCDAAEARMEESAALGEIPVDLDAHLLRCAPCREVFDSLQAMAAFEATNAVPEIDELWDQLRSQTRDAVASPIAAPEKAPLSRPASTRSSESQGWFARIFGGLITPGQSFAPAALAVALLLAGSGWWQAFQTRDAVASLRDEVSAMQVAAVESDEMMTLVRLANRSNFAQGEDGSWARIIYHKDLERGMVYAGAMPELSEGQEIACWLINEKGEAVLAWQGSELEGSEEQSWWPLEMDNTMGTYNKMVITLEPSHETVVEVPFSEQNS